MSSENTAPHDEISLRAIEADRQFQFAMAVLNAQKEDRESERTFCKHAQKLGVRVLLGMGIILLIITITAFFYDKEQFLLECLKYLATFGGGGGIGYAIGLRRGQTAKE